MDEEITETQSSLVTEEGYDIIVLIFPGQYILPKKKKQREEILLHSQVLSEYLLSIAQP